MALDAETNRSGIRPKLLKFRKLDPYELQVRSHLCLAASLPPITVNDDTLIVSVVNTPAPKTDDIVVRAKVNGHLVAVRVGWTQIRQATGNNLELLGNEDAALLLEDYLAPWFDAAEQASGLSLQLDSICEIGKLAALRPIGLQFSIAQNTTTLELWANPDAVAAIKAALVPTQTDQSGRIAVSMAEIVFERRMVLGDLDRLEVGAGIYLGAETNSAMMTIENQFSAPVKRDGDKLTLTASFSKNSPIGKRPMTETAAPEANTDFDNLEVRLQVRAGEALIALADLKTLAPGAVLSLPGYDGGSVDLLVNDQKIGRGNLVEVPGGRAVEITELFSNG